MSSQRSKSKNTVSNILDNTLQLQTLNSPDVKLNEKSETRVVDYDNFIDGMYKSEHDLASVTPRRDQKDLTSNNDRIVLPA